MLPGLAGRPVTRTRWPNGTGNSHTPFFTKDLDQGTPEWVRRIQLAHTDHRGRGDTAWYPLIETEADLAWMGQLAALELHVPQWRIPPAGALPPAADADRAGWMPNRVVIDLDPGPGTGLPECVAIAHAIRDRLGPLGRRILPVTSGRRACTWTSRWTSRSPRPRPATGPGRSPTRWSKPCPALSPRT